MRLILLAGFCFVPFGRKVKFKILAQFRVDHLFPPFRVYYNTPGEFFTLASADDLSLESEWQQVSWIIIFEIIIIIITILCMFLHQ